MPSCSCLPDAQDSEYDLLRKLLTAVCNGGGGGGGGSAIVVQDEGITLTNGVTLFNFVGSGVVASAIGNNVTVTIAGGGGTGDVVGPAGAVNNDIVTFNGVTGKLVKDSGVLISSLITTANLQSGSQAIGNAQTTIAVVFPIAFASAPHVISQMGHPTGEAQIVVNVLTDTITVNGFTARFSGSTPSANYKLQWIAHI